MTTRSLLILAVILIAIWIVASITRFVVGAALHLLLVVAVILLILGLVRRIRSKI